MAYNRQTGQWEYEDPNVAKGVTDLIATNNPLIQQARQNGLAQANRRGMLNSTLAIGASQAEAYKAAIPIASQNSTQMQQSNLAEQDRVSQQQRQQSDLASQMDRLRTAAGFTSDLQGQSDTAQMARLQASGTISGQQQAAQLAAAAEQQRVAGTQSLANITAQGTVQSGLNAQDAAAQMARLQASLTGADAQQTKTINAQMDQLRTQIAAQSALATQQGEIQASAADKQNAAAWASLQAQLANANAQQATDIKAQMDRLQANSQANLSALAAQNTYALGQNAQQAGFTQQLATLQGNIQSALQASGAQQQTALAQVQGQIQSTLQSQANDQQLQRMSADYAQQTKMQSAEQTNAMERLRTSGDQSMAQLASQQAAELQKLSLNLAQQDRQGMAASVVTIFQQEANMRAALLANTAIPAAERASYEQAISTLGNPARQFIAQLYGSPVASTAAGGLNAGGALGGTPAPVATAPVTNPGAGVASGPIANVGGGLNAGGALGAGSGSIDYSNFNTQPIIVPQIQSPMAAVAPAAGGGYSPGIVAQEPYYAPAPVGVQDQQQAAIAQAIEEQRAGLFGRQSLQ